MVSRAGKYVLRVKKFETESDLNRWIEDNAPYALVNGQYSPASGISIRNIVFTPRSSAAFKDDSGEFDMDSVIYLEYWELIDA